MGGGGGGRTINRFKMIINVPLVKALLEPVKRLKCGVSPCVKLHLPTAHIND